KLIERYPQNPQLKNYLSVAYGAAGKMGKVKEINQWIIEEHPVYLFGLINQANIAVAERELERVPELVGEKFDLKALYPERETFHLSEVTSFHKLLVNYFGAKGDFKEAENQLTVLEEIAADHYDTKEAQDILLMHTIKSGLKQFEEEEETKIRVEATSSWQNMQTTQEPVFNHPEMEWLYQFDSNIEREKIEKIIALPRESLVEDLKTILQDIIWRYEYFREREERSNLAPEESFFGCHAVYLMGELEATELLEPFLETLKQDSDFLNFWYFDLLTEDFWEPLLKAGKGQLEKLQEFVLTPYIYTYARAVVFTVFSQIALHYPERRKEIIDCLGKIMDSILTAEPDSGIVDSELNGFLVCDATEIQGIELLDKIERLYENDYVSVGVAGSWESIKKDIYKKPRFSYKRKFNSVFERYEELNRVARNNFSAQDKTEKEESFSYNENKPVISEPKVGRNDPCPCGSGKKYKKCCWNK
ncbi:MAG: DUF1186 domain-containing protein, partial [Bacteroidales bacterium]|nr:DUF1186 domain-containing protein [Bacteroidales bacterium]